MARDVTITSIRFRNFKAFRTFSISLRRSNILVGPNNSGKSTILGACRVLSAGIRHARAKSPQWITIPGYNGFGYHLSPETIPISLENVHTDYNEEISTVDFRVSNGHQLRLYFSADRECYLLAHSPKVVRRPADFRREFPLTIGVVPILGPVEHNEPIVEVDTVNRALQTHRASRHFRNYWRFFPDGFTEFAELMHRTWPSMTINPPERTDSMENTLQMFCSEGRIPRELYWAGFGYQAWCQLLTHVSRARDDALVVIDEPEIYLHPDVQRQLLGILRDLGPDILTATHSTELMTEADPSEILLVDKSRLAAKRVKDIEGVQQALDSIGSVQNITLTRLARNRRVLFVEGDRDFSIIRRFARCLGLQQLSSASEITAVESGGFSAWERIKSLSWGIERTLGRSIVLAAVFDRDFWCDEEISKILTELHQHLAFAHIHSRKEIENYLLAPTVLDRAIRQAVDDRIRRGGQIREEIEPAASMLTRLTEASRSEIQGQYVAKRSEFFRGSSRDTASVTTESIRLFEAKWRLIESRIEILDGGDTLRSLRVEVHRRWKVSLTDAGIINAFRSEDIPVDFRELLLGLDRFRVL